MKPLIATEVALEGRTLVEASAGTGKTFTITTLVLRLLLERKLTIDQILVVTFTRAATAELRERIRSRIHDMVRLLRAGAVDDPVLHALVERLDDRADALQRLSDALVLFDEAPIATIHGFCQRVLQDNAFATRASFEADVLVDERPLLKEIATDFVVKFLHDEDPLLVTRFKAIGVAGLMRLGQRLLSLEASVLPERRLAEGNLEAARARWHTAFETLRRCREETPDVLERLLTGSLHRGSYKAATLPGFLEDLDAILLREEPFAALSDKHFKLFGAAKIAGSTRKKETPPSAPFFDAVDEFLAAEAELAAFADLRLTNLKLDFAEYLRAEVNSRKHARGQLGYGDFLVQLRDGLARSPSLATSLRERYPVALIDEFQDTDPVQWQVFSLLYPDEASTMFLIGDPKQAIYSFRGADIFTYLQAAQAVDARYTLDTNWRSDVALVECLNGLYKGAPSSFAAADITYRPVTATHACRLRGPGKRAAPLRIRVPAEDWGGGSYVTTGANTPFPGLVADEVLELINGELEILEGETWRPLEARDVAVLTRTNRQAAAIQQALLERGVAAVMQTDSSVFDTPAAEELLRLLVAVASPTDAGNLRSALATRWLGRTAQEIAGLESDDGAWDREVEMFRSWHEAWRDKGFVQAFTDMMSDEVLVRALHAPGGERAVTDMLHLGELLHRAATTEHLGIHALLAWFERMLGDNESRGAVAEDAQVRLESDAHAVSLTSIHRSKGLEYPVVVLPHLTGKTTLFDEEKRHPRFHDERRGLCLSLQEPPDAEMLARAGADGRAEAMRVQYVALTRAKHQLLIFYGALDGVGRSSLFALLDPHTERFTELAKLTPPEFCEDLCAKLGGVPGVDVGLAGADAVSAAPSSAFTLTAVARTLGRSLSGAWRTSSFSRLISGASEAWVEGPVADRDAGETGSDATTDRGARVPLADFPAGARAGNFFHDVLEHHDLARGADGLRLCVERNLDRHGFSPEWAGTVTSALGGVLQVPLFDEGPALADLEPADRLPEMEFIVPLDRERGLLTAKLLAQTLVESGDDVAAAYGARATLKFPPIHGFLRGFIDLVYRHDGRHYLLDYKSNRLGLNVEDYAAPHLRAAMIDHHYVLQYLLYAVALHRHLRAQLPGYRYEEHFGGVQYLFLRGMATSSKDPRAGVFARRPPESLIESLSAALGGEGPLS